MSTFSVSSIIEKAENRDKDLRHMALYDLYAELQKENVKLDDTSQKQLADIVLKLLDDKHADVQGMAVKCMGPLVTKMSKFQVENSVSKLTQNLLKGDDEKRDIATIALKTVISKPPIAIAIGPVKKALPLLVNAMEQEVAEVKLDALDVLNDILKRFGNLIVSSHNILQTAFMNELGNPRDAVRKRASTALAMLSQHTSATLFKTLTDSIIFNIRASLDEGGVKLRTYIQLTSQVAKNSGHRLGKKMDEIIDLLLKASENIADWADKNDGNDESESDHDEIREYIMQAMESFILKCHNEVTGYVELIIILCGEYIEYDPNFSYEESGEEELEGEMADESSDDGFGGDDDEGFGESDKEEVASDAEYTNDDDITWKVRKSAARCLLALIKTKPDQLDMMYKYLCSKESHIILSRFKEREESVKLEVFKVFETLLSQTYSVMTTSKGETIVTPHKEVSYLKETKGMIVERILKQIGNKSPRVKHACFSAFKELSFTMQGGLNDYIGKFIKHSKEVLGMAEQHSTLKLVTLEFLHILLLKHEPKCFLTNLDLLLETVYARVQDKYYRITAEAIKVCSSLVPVLEEKGDISKTKGLFKVVFEKLKVQDIDQDVKENAIKTMGVILSSFGTDIPSELKQALPIILKRLKNETTRLVTCKCVGKIAASKVNLTSVIGQIIEELSSFMRKNHRALRQAALSSLTIIVRKYFKYIDDGVIVELAKLVSDQDLHLAHLSLTLAHTILKANPSTIGSIEKNVLPRILDLLGSSTLQGSAVDSSMLVVKGLTPKIGYSSMLNTILSAIKGEDISKQVYINIAQSVSGLIEVGSTKDQKDTIGRFQKDLSSKKMETKMLSLFTIGEIGRKIDLSGNTAIVGEIQKNFDSNFEEIKNAASYALGNVAIGNLDDFVPKILVQIKEHTKKKYLLIHSLKEIIVRADPKKLEPFTEQIIPLLFDHANNKEEGVRNVVSECLGKLCLQFYKPLMPQLKEYVGNKSSKSKGKACVISAVKYVITERPLPIDEFLKDDLPLFLSMLNKEEKVNVRRSSILLLTSVAHNKPVVIVTILGKILPNLYAECKFDPSLERIINLGPFKHKVDDGLELRKSSFECLDTLLSTMRDYLNGLDFVTQLIEGFQDKNNDIKMLAHIIAIKCCQYFPTELLSIIGKCCQPIQKLLKRRIRDSALQQEKERHEELVKSTLKVIYSISKLKESSDVLPFVELIERTIPNTQKLKNYYQTLKAEDEEEFSDILVK